MKHFVLVLSFFLVLLASCERTEIEHGFAEEVESVFFNPDTASSQLVSCVMKNGDSLSLYGEKDSVGMPLSITHLQYYSSEKKIGALMTFDDGLPSKVLVDDGSSVSFEWITRRRANVEAKDPKNHMMVSGVLDLDSVYSEDPHLWDSIIHCSAEKNAYKRNVGMHKNVRANEEKMDSKDAIWGQSVHVDFKKCGEYTQVDNSYLKVYDGSTKELIDIVFPTIEGNGYNYFVEAYIPIEYEINADIAIQIGRILDALLNGISEGGNLGKIATTIQFFLAAFTGGTSAVAWSFAKAMMTEIAALVHSMAGENCFEDLGRDWEQFYYSTHQNCYAQVYAEGEVFPVIPITYGQHSYFRSYELPSNPQITTIILSPQYCAVWGSCIPFNPTINVCTHIIEYRGSEEPPLSYWDCSEYLLYEGYEEGEETEYYTGLLAEDRLYDGILIGLWIKITLPNGEVLTARAGR